MEDNLEGEAREEFWRDVICSQKSSGMICRKYCESRGLSYDKFKYWRMKFRRVDRLNSVIRKESDFVSVANFVESNLTSEDTLKENNYKIELELPFGIKLRIGAIS